MLYADVISFFVTRNIRKSVKIVNIDRENLHIFWTTLETSTKFKIFRKDVTCDNIKSRKNPLSRTCIFGKTTEGSNWPPNLLRNKTTTSGEHQTSCARNNLLLNGGIQYACIIHLIKIFFFNTKGFQLIEHYSDLINLFPMYPFSTPWKQKTVKTLTVFWCFEGLEKWCIGKNGLKYSDQ